MFVAIWIIPVLIQHFASYASAACLSLYGTGCKTDTDCALGLKCNYFEGWSQCLESPVYLQKSSECNRLFNSGDWGCLSNATCCNPYAYCNSNKLCVLKNTCPVTSKPTTAPTMLPTLILSTVNEEKLCQYALGCKSDNDCVKGTACQLNQYWSQCVEPSSNLKTGICKKTNADWGCNSNSDCCNKDASCSQNRLCVLSSSCVKSFVPTKLPTSKATNIPTSPNQLPGKHVVLILVDDNGFNDIGYKDQTFHTPAINSLANNGIILTDLYVASTCSPTRGALLTGKNVNKINLQDGAFLLGENRTVPLHFDTLPKVLKEVGYKTIGIGKWHLGASNESYMPTSRGFDEWFGNLDGAIDPQNYTIGVACGSQNPKAPYPANRYPPTFSSNCLFNNAYDLVDNLRPAIEYKKAASIYITELFGMKAVEKIKQHPKNSVPLFLYLAPTAPHTPLQAPKKYISRCPNVKNPPNLPINQIFPNSRQISCGMMAAVDDMVLNITNALKEKGMYNDTLIFFLSDNGGITSYGTSNGVFRGQKGSFLDGGVRVSGFISGVPLNPSAKNTSFNGLVFVTDIFATIAAHAGVNKAVVSQSDGFPLLDNSLSISKTFNRTSVFLGATGFCAGLNSFGLVFTFASIKWKYVNFPNAISILSGYDSTPLYGLQFYNLNVDPSEKNNLFTSNNTLVLAALSRASILAHQMKDQGSPSVLDVAGGAFYYNQPTSTGCWIPSDDPYAMTTDCKLSVLPLPAAYKKVACLSKNLQSRGISLGSYDPYAAY